MKRVILFGDSNTYGRIPGTEDGRYPHNLRWPTMLQEQLGPEWNIYDEGYPGRTILPLESCPIELNGYEYICTALSRHVPFDYLLIMLGTNDFKTKYNISAEDAAEGMKRLLNRVSDFSRENDLNPALIIAAPPIFMPVSQEKAELFKDAHEKMMLFSRLLQELAYTYNVSFLDTSAISVDIRDGIHLSDKTQHIMAKFIHDKLLSI